MNEVPTWKIILMIGGFFILFPIAWFLEALRKHNDKRKKASLGHKLLRDNIIKNTEKSRFK